MRCVAAVGNNAPNISSLPNLGAPAGLVYVRAIEQATRQLDGDPDLTISACTAPPANSAFPEPRMRETIRVGPVTWASSVQPPEQTTDEHKICASRLMMLHFAAEDRAHLSVPRQRRAVETLDRWRLRVAMWEEMPAAPLDERIAGALTNSLGTEARASKALVLLHRLEADLTIPSGAKFSAFMQADRVLGLDLGHLIGKIRH